MSKAAVDMFTRVLAKTLGPRRITVNSVLPGFNVTETNSHLVEDAVMRKQIEDLTALGRFWSARRHRRGGAFSGVARRWLGDQPDHRGKRWLQAVTKHPARPVRQAEVS
jgi:NAD(P)-dependent dehydrogenase (short-subunit alcohol dehydrogenase family)